MKNKRFAKRLFFLFLLNSFLGLFFISAFSSQTISAQTNTDLGTVIVIKVDGLVDEIVADFIEDSIKTATTENALALVLQVDSKNIILNKARFEKLSYAITNSEIPIASWIGPSGSNARGDVAKLVLLTTPIGISPGTTISVGNENIGYNDLVDKSANIKNLDIKPSAHNRRFFNSARRFSI